MKLQAGLARQVCGIAAPCVAIHAVMSLESICRGAVTQCHGGVNSKKYSAKSLRPILLSAQSNIGSHASSMPQAHTKDFDISCNDMVAKEVNVLITCWRSSGIYEGCYETQAPPVHTEPLCLVAAAPGVLWRSSE